MKPSAWPEWIESDLWAKSADKGEGCEPESLPAHTWAALERLTGFINLRPRLPDEINQPDLWNILYWGTFLHDFGKSMPAFQGLLRGQKAAKDEWARHRHEVFSLAFLEWLESGLDQTQLEWIAAAVVSHHREANDIETAYLTSPDLSLEAIEAQFSQIPQDSVQGLYRWITECGWPWAQELGLDRLAVRQVTEFQPLAIDFCERASENIIRRLYKYSQFVNRLKHTKNLESWPALIALRGHLIQADHNASAHTDIVSRPVFAASLILKPLAEKKITLNDLHFHQRISAITEGSALLTAPTGSGKTEAALLWASRLHDSSADGLPRLFYTLPYQASMNAMALRLKEIYGDEHVGLQHGRSLLALYRMLLERSYSPAEAGRVARLERNLAKLNHPTVKVFSPFQMLKAMYRLKGYEAMLSDFYKAAFVFDEIHAYEPARLAMIFKMIEYLRTSYQARFFVMSATFPTLIKKALKETLGSPDEIEAEPALFTRFQRHRVEIMDGELLDDKNLDLIVRDAKAGKLVLVVCNLVDRAQTAYELLLRKSNGCVDMELLHGRFNMRDRSRKEIRIRNTAGLNTIRQKSMILVATQAIEVSLNIDLDTIYTDPAPLEALVQRFGRINRVNKLKELAAVHVFRKPDDGQIIYDEVNVKRALAILEREDGRPLDENAVGDWLNEIYTGDVAEKWQSEYNRSAADFEAVCVRTLRPFEADEQMENAFYKAFDGIEILPDCLYDEYENQKEEDYILSKELLVTISWGRYKGLSNQGLVLPRDRNTPPIVMANYDADLGLTFDANRENEFDE